MLQDSLMIHSQGGYTSNENGVSLCVIKSNIHDIKFYTKPSIIC